VSAVVLDSAGRIGGALSGSVGRGCCDRFAWGDVRRSHIRRRVCGGRVVLGPRATTMEVPLLGQAVEPCSLVFGGGSLWGLVVGRGVVGRRWCDCAVDGKRYSTRALGYGVCLWVAIGLVRGSGAGRSAETPAMSFTKRLVVLGGCFERDVSAEGSARSCGVVAPDGLNPEVGWRDWGGAVPRVGGGGRWRGSFRVRVHTTRQGVRGSTARRSGVFLLPNLWSGEAGSITNALGARVW